MIDLKRYKAYFCAKNVCVQFVIINVVVFLFVAILLSLSWLFQLQKTGISGITDYFMIYSQPSHFFKQPWSIFTYMFLHADLIHLFFNMICLYSFGQLFLLFFNANYFKGVYLWGGFLGGLFYLLAYNMVPAFQSISQDVPMVGASASILALITAAAYANPNYKVNLFLLGRYALKYIAIGFVILDLLLLPKGNAGGHVAHLGGAFAGILFAIALKRGIDVTWWLLKPLQLVKQILMHFSSSSSLKKKPRMKVHYAERKKDYEFNAQKKEQSQEVDRILEKLKKSGYESLTTTEKQTLFNASKKD